MVPVSGEAAAKGPPWKPGRTLTGRQRDCARWGRHCARRAEIEFRTEFDERLGSNVGPLCFYGADRIVC